MLGRLPHFSFRRASPPFFGRCMVLAPFPFFLVIRFTYSLHFNSCAYGLLLQPSGRFSEFCTVIPPAIVNDNIEHRTCSFLFYIFGHTLLTCLFCISVLPI